MKKVLKGILALTMVCSLAACGSSSSDDSSSEVTTITVATSPDYDPYEALDTDGNMYGFDIDMVELFNDYAKDDGYEFEFVQMDFDNIIAQVNNGQVDLGISGFTYSEDRKVEWSNPYLGTNQVALLKADSDISSSADLKGKKLVAQSGATGVDVAKDLSDDVTDIKNVTDIANYLQQGQFDAAIIDSGVAKKYASNADYKVLDEVLLEEKNYIIAKEGNTEIIELVNKYIEKFMASDDYQTLCDKYDLVAYEG